MILSQTSCFRLSLFIISETVKETEKVPSETAVTSEKTRKSEKARKNGTPDSGKSASDSEEKSFTATAQHTATFDGNGGTTPNPQTIKKYYGENFMHLCKKLFPIDTVGIRVYHIRSYRKCL